MTSVHVVGIGLDGADGLVESVRQLVERATLLIGSDRHLSYFPNHQSKSWYWVILLKQLRQFASN